MFHGKFTLRDPSSVMQHGDVERSGGGGGGGGRRGESWKGNRVNFLMSPVSCIKGRII